MSASRIQKGDNKDALVSIIIPMHNAAAVLPRTLNSLKEQTYDAFEVIMVDDCSTDDTRDIAQRYLTDERFKLVQMSQNGGVANARNKGLDLATGAYICFLDADDWWHERKLEIQTEWMKNNLSDISYMDYVRIEEGTDRILSEVKPPVTVDFQTLLKSNFIGNLTAMVRRQAIGSVRFTKTGHEDYIFWLSILRNGGMAQKVPTAYPLCFYLVRQVSLSSNKLKAAKWQWRIYRHTLNMSPVRALWYLGCYVFYALRKRG